MRSHLLTALCAGILLAVVAGPSGAFYLSGAGFRGGFTDPENLDGTVSMGGHLEFEQRGTHLHLQPNLSYWSSGNVKDVNPNFDLYYHFAPAGFASPYLGAGLGLHFLSVDPSRSVDASETNPGFNLFGGMLFAGRSARFFIEGRATLTELGSSSILGGVTFPLGH